MMMLASSSVAVKRVVTCFILSSSSTGPQQLAGKTATIATRDTLRVAVFRRCRTMPTFPSHWAGISGSMEEGEEPWQTAQRELQEETNLVPTTVATLEEGETCSASETASVACEFVQQGGLYLDVPFQKHRIIRVYPFVVQLDATKGNVDTYQQRLQLRGTEHDTFQFLSVPELEQLEPTVPGLATAFHHATYGQYLDRAVLPAPVWQWSEDRVNGAATLANQVLELVVTYPTTTANLATIAMLRPTMVPIVNVLRAMEKAVLVRNNDQEDPSQARHDAGREIRTSLEHEVDRAVQLGATSLRELFHEAQQQPCRSEQNPTVFTIATFSRSSTILKVVTQFLQELRKDAQQSSQPSTTIHILCAKSTPGGEGTLLQQDLAAATSDQDHVTVQGVDDDILHQSILQGSVNVVLVGSDCIMDEQVVNKVGTKALAETCRQAASAARGSLASTTSMVCCADRWKLWEDAFPPPLEDIFECVPRSLLDNVWVPPPPGSNNNNMLEFVER